MGKTICDLDCGMTIPGSTCQWAGDWPAQYFGPVLFLEMPDGSQIAYRKRIPTHPYEGDGCVHLEGKKVLGPYKTEEGKLAIDVESLTLEELVAIRKELRKVGKVLA